MLEVMTFVEDLVLKPESRALQKLRLNHRHPTLRKGLVCMFVMVSILTRDNWSEQKKVSKRCDDVKLISEWENWLQPSKIAATSIQFATACQLCLIGCLLSCCCIICYSELLQVSCQCMILKRASLKRPTKGY
jgi:hypothetical protein